MRTGEKRMRVCIGIKRVRNRYKLTVPMKSVAMQYVIECGNW